MIFVSAGHHQKQTGASYDGFTEFDEAVVWRELITERLPQDISMPVPLGFLKDKVNYINQRDPSRSIAVEIHFNSAADSDGNRIGKGCETLHYPNSEDGIALASIVQLAMAELIQPDRGIKAGYYRMDPENGVDFFLERTRCPAIIIEPEFIHRKSIIKEKRGAVCNRIALALVEAHNLLRA